MTENFYRGRQADIVAGSANFAARLAAGFAGYGLTQQQSDAFAAVNAELQSAFAASTTPDTRTPVAIARKDAVLAGMRNEAKLLARIIYATPTVTDAQLTELGLLPRRAPKPIPAATDPPVVEVVSVVGRLVKVRIRGATGQTSRKPAGSAGAHVYWFVGTQPPTDPRQYWCEGLATRATTDILFPNDVPSGATAWIAAAWVSQRGQRGKACNPVQVTIQGGPVLAESA